MDKSLGVYIHIPFCASKCGYCDFYSLAGCDGRMGKYEDAVIKHIEESAPALAQYYTDSVYFGGGTPSYFGAARLIEIFSALKRSGQVLKSSEVTVECNPDSMDRRELSRLRSEGVNRLSIGIQSANDDILKMIGRRHNFKQARAAMKKARDAGFHNVSVDVIYGLPSQTKDDWADTLARVLALKPEHVSCYGLKMEKGTPMYYDYMGSEILPSDDEQADMYLYAVETLERYGYGQYEISNFAMRGFESRHNMKYWALDDYMGFGPGAHSCIGDLRYSYRRDLEGYMSGITSGGSILDEYERIGSFERAAEYLMLGMRRSAGISREEYYNIYRSDFSAIEELMREFEKGGWTQYIRGRWSFTSSGFLLSNILIGELLEAQAKHKLSGNPWIGKSEIDAKNIILPSVGETY